MLCGHKRHTTAKTLRLIAGKVRESRTAYTPPAYVGGDEWLIVHVSRAKHCVEPLSVVHRVLIHLQPYQIKPL